MPSLKLLKKFFWVVSVVLAIALGAWISLDFITEMEELQGNALILRYWVGIYRASRLLSVLLAGLWAILVVLQVVVSIREDYPYKSKKNSEEVNIDIGDLSEFE